MGQGVGNELLLLQVMSWGGYSFIINLVPIHCLACIFTGRLNSKLYVAFAPFIILGTIEAGGPSVTLTAVLNPKPSPSPNEQCLHWGAPSEMQLY